MGASVIITVFIFWLKDRKAKKIQKNIIKNMETMSKLEKDSYLRNGGDINISDKEVKENERQSELRRRKLSELRELEATNRGIEKPTFDFGNGKGTSEGFYVSSMAFDSPREEHKESRGTNKKIRFDSSEEF